MKKRNQARLIMSFLAISLFVLILIFGSNDIFTVIALIGSIGLCSFYIGRFVNDYDKIESEYLK